MTSQQRNLIIPLLLSMQNVKTMEQVDLLWAAIDAACRQAGVQVGNKPTSVPQAKTTANALRMRLLGNR